MSEQRTFSDPTGRTEAVVTSGDGTRIAYDRQGSGPVIVLVASALADRSDTAKMARLLADRFTVINYDRRGRGDSADTRPYAVEREIEDLAAIVREAGGSAYVFGSSSGAVLALRAAARGVNITKLAIYEPPLRLEHAAETALTSSAAQVRELLAAGRDDDVVRHFMREDVQVPAPLLFVMRRLMRGMWSRMAAMAHTLPYDYAIVAEPVDGQPIADLSWLRLTIPTLLMDGGKSPDHLRRPVKLLAEAIPGARTRTLERQNHGAVMMAPKAVAAAVAEFFQADGRGGR
jgi:pimeloyl-ACP methyl ester carboxylesterase